MRSKAKAEIDTRAPFKSVKDAVTLFSVHSDRLLNPPPIITLRKKFQIEQNKIKDEDASSLSRLWTIKGELEETKQNLQKAKEESMHIANCLYSLQEELESTKLEIQQLKDRSSNEIRVMLKKEMEGLKFTESLANVVEVKKRAVSSKKYVKFENPLPFRVEVLSRDVDDDHEMVLLRHPSLKEKKKKKLIPLIGGIFCKMNGISHKKYGASEV